MPVQANNPIAHPEIKTPRAAAHTPRRVVTSLEAAYLAPARIALFSLGNLAAHKCCGQALRALGLPEQLADLQTTDSTLLKYSNRIAQKLDEGSRDMAA